MKQMICFLFALIFSMTVRSQSDSLKVPWPADWKIGSEEKTRTQIMTEYIPKSEKIDHWTILGTTIVYKGIIGNAEVPIEKTMNIMFNESKKTAINPTLTVIDKKAEGDNTWILFKIEAAGFTTSNKPESQLFFIIEGKNDLFSNFVAIKKSALSKEFVDHWSEIFKASQFTKE